MTCPRSFHQRQNWDSNPERLAQANYTIQPNSTGSSLKKWTTAELFQETDDVPKGWMDRWTNRRTGRIDFTVRAVSNSEAHWFQVTAVTLLWPKGSPQISLGVLILRKGSTHSSLSSVSAPFLSTCPHAANSKTHAASLSALVAILLHERGT